MLADLEIMHQKLYKTLSKQRSQSSINNSARAAEDLASPSVETNGPLDDIRLRGGAHVDRGGNVADIGDEEDEAEIFEELPIFSDVKKQPIRGMYVHIHLCHTQPQICAYNRPCYTRMHVCTIVLALFVGMTRKIFSIHSYRARSGPSISLPQPATFSS